MQVAGTLVIVALYLVAFAVFLVGLAAFSLLPAPLAALLGYWWEAASIAWGAAEALAVATEAWAHLYRWWVAAAVATVGIAHTAREFWPWRELRVGPWSCHPGTFGRWLNFAVSPAPKFYAAKRWWRAAQRRARNYDTYALSPCEYRHPVTHREELVTAAALVVADVGLAVAGAIHSPGWWAAWAAFRLGDTGCHWIGWLWSRLRGPGTRSSLATAAVGVVVAPLLVTHWWAVLAGLGSPLTYTWAWARARR